jgi:ribosomal protein S18 acetylase RimI-like enzyme
VGHTYLMTSDVAWQFPGCAPKDNIRLWRDRSGLAAYGWFQPPDTIKFDVRPDVEASHADPSWEILAWAEARRQDFPGDYPFYIDLKSMAQWADVVATRPVHPLAGNRYLVTSALDTDAQRKDFLGQRGFEPTEHFAPILTCRLDGKDESGPPTPFELRHVEEADFDARVALHSAAWAPASGFDMHRYLRVRAIAEVFDPELDIVAVAPDGTFASYTIAWKDPVSRIGSFEPFGTRPGFRGSGVSRAVIHEGFRRLAARGMEHARIYTAGFNHQAARLYQSCGFSQVDTERTYLKRL